MVDYNKITRNAKFVAGTDLNTVSVYRAETIYYTARRTNFTYVGSNSSQAVTATISMGSGSNIVIAWYMKSAGTTYNDSTNSNPPAGYIMRVYYR